MYCNNCGQKIVDGVKYCPFCGAALFSDPGVKTEGNGEERSDQEIHMQPGQDKNAPPGLGKNAQGGRGKNTQPGRNKNAQGGPPKTRKEPGLLMILLMLCALVLAAIIGVIMYTGTDSYQVKRQLSLGDRYLEDKDYERAVAAYESAVKIDPKSVDAYLGLATAHSEYAEDLGEKAENAQEEEDAENYTQYIVLARAEATYASDTYNTLVSITQEQADASAQDGNRDLEEEIEQLQTRNTQTDEKINSMPDTIDGEADGSAAGKEDIRHAYGQYLTEELVPEYGIVNDEDITSVLYYSDVYNDSGYAPSITWHSRDGIIGADYADLDGNGAEEMLVYSLRSEDSSYDGVNNDSGTHHVVSGYVTIYRYEDNTVAKVCEERLFSSLGVDFFLNGAGVFTLDGSQYLYVQTYETGAFADGGAAFYRLYTLRGDDLDLSYELGRSALDSWTEVQLYVRTYTEGILQDETLAAVVWGSDNTYDGVLNTDNIYDGLMACWNKIGVNLDPGANAVFDEMPDYRKSELVRGGFSYSISAKYPDDLHTGADGGEYSWKFTSRLDIGVMYKPEKTEDLSEESTENSGQNELSGRTAASDGIYSTTCSHENSESGTYITEVSYEDNQIIVTGSFTFTKWDDDGSAEDNSTTVKGEIAFPVNGDTMYSHPVGDGAWPYTRDEFIGILRNYNGEEIDFDVDDGVVTFAGAVPEDYVDEGDYDDY